MRHGPFRGSLDVERMAAYAATTGATKAAVLAGDAVPAIRRVFASTRTQPPR